MDFLRQFFSEQRGSGAIEVAVIMGVGIALMMFAINSFGSAVQSSIESSGSKLNGALTTQPVVSRTNEQNGRNSVYRTSH